MNPWLLVLLGLAAVVWAGLRLSRCRGCGIPFTPVRAFLEILVMDGTCGRCRRG